MTLLFVSDLHLDPARASVTECFLRFLDGPARGAEALYILGDLFEAWIGDDNPDPHHARVRDALRRYREAGHQCFLMHGNRDFLLGERFCSAAGITLLADPHVADIQGERVLLMHGDLLCTDDQDYQAYRRRVRRPLVQRAYLALPLALRARIAGGLRGRSRVATALKPEDITDAHPGEVTRRMREHGVRTMIHGHTHRPAVHRIEIDGRPAVRIVLGDWYEQGSVLHWDADGYRLESLPID